jgi:hypothetical protein
MPKRSESLAGGPRHQVWRLGEGEDEQSAPEAEAPPIYERHYSDPTSLRERSNAVKRTPSDAAPRKRVEGHSAAHDSKPRAHKISKSIASSERDLSMPKTAGGKARHSHLAPSLASTRGQNPPMLAHKKSIASSERDLFMRRTASGNERHSRSTPSLASMRGHNPSSFAVEDRNVYHLRRELMNMFQEGLASNAIVLASESSPLCTGTAGALKGSPTQPGGYLARIWLLVFNVCWFVVVLPVAIVKAVLSDQPPWCAPSPRVESPLRPASRHANQQSASPSTWQSIMEILDSLSFDPSV